MKRTAAFLLALILLAGMGSLAHADQLSDIQAKGKLIVGASIAFPPYEFYYTNPQTGQEEAAGFDMNLAHGIADAIGVELVLEDLAFAGLITSLRSGEIDMIISALAIRPDRLEAVDFSDVYYGGTQILLVRAEDYDAILTEDDLAGKVVAAQMGSLQAGILEDQFGASEHLVIDQIALMVKDLMLGTVDGVLLTDNVANSYIRLNPGKLAISQVAVRYDLGTGVGVAVRKGDNETLLALVNDYIAQVLADGTFEGWVAEANALNDTLLADTE